MPLAPETARKTMENYVKAWGSNDKALLLSLFTEDAILEDPVGTPAFKGTEGVAKFWDFAHIESDRQLSPKFEEIRVCADQAIFRFTMQVRIPSEHITFADDGRIKHLRAFWDETSVGKPDGMDLFIPNIDQAYE
jgi:steroid Delta-isomerase